MSHHPKITSLGCLLLLTCLGCGTLSRDGFVQAEGRASVSDGVITLERGGPYSSVRWAGDIPRSDYEISLQAKRTAGRDIFCGIFFPVGETACTMILGGWGDSVVGLSCIDYMPAMENDTAVGMSFDDNAWYEVVLRVTDERIQAWIDGEQVIAFDLEDRIVEPYPGLEMLAPFGFFTYESAAELQEITIEPLPNNQ